MDKSELFAEIMKNDKKCIYCKFKVEWLGGAVAIGDKYAHLDCKLDQEHKEETTREVEQGRYDTYDKETGEPQI